MDDDRTVLGRATLILDVVTRSSEPLTLAALTAQTSLPKPTVRRIAQALVARSLLEQRAGLYLPGRGLVALGGRALEHSTSRRAAAPHLQDLFARCAEVVFLGLLDGPELVMVDVLVGNRRHAELAAEPWPVVRTTRPEALCSAAGRLLLSARLDLAATLHRAGVPRMTPYTEVGGGRLRDALQRARDTGIAVEEEQLRSGWACVAAALHDGDDVVGVLGVAGHAGTLKAHLLAGHVLRAAEAASSGQAPARAI
ncbi:MAG TPA: IclR family transcriptional regulator C-terminal domain-containing protein [Propionicimonas sp.]|jgi:DNA-binding IclR family transcriptional regulator